MYAIRSYYARRRRWQAGPATTCSTPLWIATAAATLLAVVMLVSALLSALFINDTAVLMLTPLVAETALALSLNPIPFLIGLALAANIGSMATPIGNPQNILIATARDLGFGQFVGTLAVPALISLLLAYGLIRLIYRKRNNFV